ncbi:MAG TPA: DUF3943 domain-containing protein [Polyangiaceae bacterium]|nr:DUF3943 domain-containing protein [Polyangiaceae bacterium]
MSHLRWLQQRAAQARRVFLAGAIACSVICTGSRPCRADNTIDPNASLLSYRPPERPRYVRLALEELALLGLGLGQYWLDHETNSRDWHFNYDWSSFRARLDGSAYAFDTNFFNTNFLQHPAAGTFYYLTARSNRLSPLESLAIAFGTSAVWEFFGEFQENVSVNDVIVTPVAGMALGETLTQLGAYFLRECPSTSNQILGSALAPFTALHDAIDGAERLTVCDGISPSWHRFRLQLQGGEAWSEGRSPYAVLRTGLETEVINLPGFAQPGSESSTFGDGNASRLRFGLSFSNVDSFAVSDLSILTQTVVAGLHHRNNRFEGRGLKQSEAIFGLLVGAEYTLHRFDPRAEPDRVFLLDLPAFSARYYGGTKSVGWELVLDAGGAFGGADSLLLAQKNSGNYNPDLTTVAATQGYNHVIGVKLNPQARLDLGVAQLGVEFRSERLIGWRALDESGRNATTPIGEARRRSLAWISLGAPRVERLLFSIGRTERESTLGELRAKRTELSMNLGFELAL